MLFGACFLLAFFYDLKHMNRTDVKIIWINGSLELFKVMVPRLLVRIINVGRAENWNPENLLWFIILMSCVSDL